MSRSKSGIVVAGANGFVGTNLRRFLSENKIQVINLTRKKHRLFKSETGIIFSDLANKNLIAKLKGCNALIHLIGIGAQTADADYHSVNVEQTNKLIRLCKKANIKKIVYLSGLGVNESTTFGYFISKLKAEQLITASELDYTILRASYIIGKDDPLTKNLQRQAKLGTILIPGSGSYRLQPISIDDVSRVIFLSVINKKLSNKIIDLVGPKTISFENFVRRFTKGKKIKIKKISAEKVYHDALSNPKNTVYGLDDLNIMLGDFVASHKRLEKLFGIKLQTL